MPTIGLEFDRDRLRAVVVDDASGEPQILRAVELEVGDKTESAVEALRDALPDVRWSRSRLVGVVGGDRLRCRLLKLPPTPESELPDMVRMQAMREFATTEADGVVDFVPLSGDAGEPRSVLAATIDQDDLARLRELAESLDASLARVVARGCGAASLAMRLSPELKNDSHLIIAAATDAADLVVVQQGRPSLVRSAKAPSDAAESIVRSEARRTSAMASQQTGERLTSHIFFGYDKHPDLTGASVLSLSPLISSSSKLIAAEADLAQQMIGVLGAAVELADEDAPAIDFVNPRRPQVDKSAKRRLYLLAGAAAASVLLGLGFVFGQLWMLDRQIAQTEKELKTQKDKIEALAPIKEKADAIEDWLATDVNWLDEVERLGRRLRPKELDDKEFPAEKDVYLSQLSAAPMTRFGASGGRLSLQVLARSRYSYDDVEDRLRDDMHIVDSPVGRVSVAGGKYGWEATTAILVNALEEELP